MHVRWPIMVALLWAATTARAQTPNDEGHKFFEQKIRPVLVEHCYACHSGDAAANKKLKGGLLLDSADGMLKGGDSGPSLVAGKAAESLLLKALKFDGVEMPPSGKLADEIVADFATWIDMGAPDPRQSQRPPPAKRTINIDEGRKHWSFQPLAVVEPPRHEAIPSDAGPIDRFVRAKQIEHGVNSNARADKEKLLRRAYFDLVGLPPSEEQAAAFMQDDSEEAFAKVVDSLLASERYGERWARHWLDAARYAESGGYEFDGFRRGAYHYRDWVIRALNGDLPYDEFIRMQLAGDKLHPDEYDGAAAAGFLVAGPYPGQITAKTVERIRYDQLDDMMMTIGGSMLGLTLGCVRCHDHKYDPISQQDYYGIAASLAKTVHGTRQYDLDPEATRLAQEKHRGEHEEFVAKVKQFAAAELPQRFEAWQKKELPKQPDAPRWQTFDAVEVDAERSYLKVLPSGLIVHDGAIEAGAMVMRRGKRVPAGEAESFRIQVQTHQKNVNALRLDVLTDKSLPQRGPGLNADGSFQLSELIATAAPLDPGSKEAPLALKLKAVFAGFEDKDQPLSQAVDGKLKSAWEVKTNAKKDNAAVFEIEGGLPGFPSGTKLTLELKFRDQGLGKFRLAMSVEPNPATWAGDSAPQHLGELRAILAANKKKLPPELREAAVRWFSPFDAEAGKVHRALTEHVASAPRGKFSEVYTTIAGGQDVFLLRRGEVDNKGDKSEPSVIQVLSRGAPSGDKQESVAADPRVGLANWMTDVEHGAGPLLARVIVNRLWQHHFGEGLVGTPNDFGAQGEAPSHPELLEWLAQELVRGGWRLKSLHRQIMLSEVYRQSERVDPANLPVDPANRWLWHHKPLRLEAETIRDALLAVGGTLDAQMYGPSVLDNTMRRSIYLRVKRSELIPLMTTFDAPEPTQSIGERISTTVPTQALVLMNSPFVRQQAEKLAQRLRTPAETSPGDAVERGYQIAFARRPTDDERSRMLAFIEAQRGLMGGDDQANADRVLVEFCQVLLCLNEFLYVD